MTDYDRQITSLSPQRHRAAVTRLVNAERKKHGLRPLLPSGQLVLSARSWAFIQRRNDGVLSHGNFARRALRFPFVVAGRPKRRRSVGENLGFRNRPVSTARRNVTDLVSSARRR